MGQHNHGIQTVTHQYHLEASGVNFGKRLLNILPTGIYSGGYLTKVSNSEVTLSLFVVEIRDSTTQVSVRSAASATLNAANLDSGAISSTTPYLVMRWGYAASALNYLEIHAIASLNDRLQNDLIIGRCVFVGSDLDSFDYSDRSFPSILDKFLRVEAASGLYVRLRGGIVCTSSRRFVVPDQLVGPFTVPASPNSRIDLVYVDTSGSVQIQQGTPAVTPSVPDYGGRLVLAEVLLVNGDTSIPWNRIIDARSFVNLPSKRDYILIRDVKAAGVNGGTFTSGAWRTRDLTEKTSDAGGNASLAANRITLEAGTYEFHIRCPASDTTSEIGLHQARLYNVTDGSVVSYGTSEYSVVSGYVTTSSIVVGKFTIASSKVFEVQHRSQGTVTTCGFGRATNFGGEEVYTVAEFWKVA